MANICSMKIVFYCNSQKNVNGLKRLHSELEKALNENEGRFSSVLDITEYPEIPMHGDFSYIGDFESDYFSASAEAYWCPMYEFLEKLCDIYSDGSDNRVYFASSSDEPDADIFEIYGDMEEDFFTHNFSIDIWGNDGSDDESAPVIKDSYEFFDTEQEMIDWLNAEEHYGTLFQADSWEAWEAYLSKYDAGHIRIWTRTENYS